MPTSLAHVQHHLPLVMVLIVLVSSKKIPVILSLLILEWVVAGATVIKYLLR